MGKGMINALIGAILAGVAGAVVWAALSYFANIELGWLAWGIGALVGVAAAFGAGKDAGTNTGVMAAVVAVLSVVGGKYAAVYVECEQVIGFIMSEPIVVEDHDMIVHEADLVIEEWEAAGRKVNWPDEDMSVEDAIDESDYPVDVWSEGKRRWERVDAADRPARMAELQAEWVADRDAAVDLMRTQYLPQAFKGSFGLFDLLFFALAIATAFRLGKGLDSLD